MERQKVLAPKDEYATLVKRGTLHVCPVSGISFTMPEFNLRGRFYVDSRHPLGVRSNYPDLFNRNEIEDLTNMELAGIILATLEFYGKLTDSLPRFKQNELLRTKLKRAALLTFIDWLKIEFLSVSQNKKPAFDINENFTDLVVYSYQRNVMNIKANIGFDTLTVVEAVENKTLLIKVGDTVKDKIKDIVASFRENVAPYIKEDSVELAIDLIRKGMKSQDGKEIDKLVLALEKKGNFSSFIMELRKYRAFFERHDLTAKPGFTLDDLDFTTEETTNEKPQCSNDQSENRPSEEHSSGTNESIFEKLARLRQATGNGK